MPLALTHPFGRFRSSWRAPGTYLTLFSFAQCIIGGEASSYQPVLPFEIPADTFEELLQAESAQSELIHACYRLKDDGSFHLDGDDEW